LGLVNQAAVGRRQSAGVIRAVLLDALGTLVRLEPPVPRLRDQVLRATDVDVGEERAAAAFGAEIAYYLSHHLEGRDRASLQDLRARCAAAMAAELPVALEGPAAVEVMLASLGFTPFPDVAPALKELRSHGLRLVVASNWDCSLPDWLALAGLAGLLDGAVSSAVVGRAKPDPAVFRAALTEAGAEPDQAVHVGDSLENDVQGAGAAGIRGLLLVREGDAPPGVESVATLGELARLI
jgi:putative hydrolase of the HAD superfamily